MGCVLQTLPYGQWIAGVTLLDALLYVLREDRSSNQIEVYDTDSYRLQRCLTVPGLRSGSDSYDITACSRNRCAYISDHITSCVHRLALPDADVTQWPVNDKPASLSVTDAHCVLVTCGQVRKIKEFTTDGQLLRQLQLSKDVVSPWRAVQLSGGKFIVCHGAFRDPLHRVCLVDPEGQVVQSYGGPPGSGDHEMNVPWHLAVDSSKFVYVADLNNYRVLLLSPSVSYIREVVSRDQLQGCPVRLCLDADKVRLYVAVNDSLSSGRIVVVSV